LDPVITSDIDAVTLRSLAKDPAERYQSAREMKNDIGRVLAGQQATAYVPRVVEPDPAATRVVPRTAVAPPVAHAVPEDEPRKSRVGVALLVTALILLLLSGGAYGIYRYLNPAPPAVEMVTVPAVLGNSRAEADSNLRNAKLAPQFRNVNGKNDQTVNTAIKQTPVGGEVVAANTRVQVDINVGPKTATIPAGLIGKDKDTVKAALEKVGFTSINLVAAIMESVDDDKDAVLTISPPEGESAALEDDVTVTYATGSSAVPVLTGRVRAQAESDAKAVGFKVKFETEESDEPAGIVIDQDPEAGERVSRGTTIELTVAVPRPPPTPSTTAAPPPTTPPPSVPPTAPPTQSQPGSPVPPGGTETPGG
jgi:serine/threonine-protein kinase